MVGFSTLEKGVRLDVESRGPGRNPQPSRIPAFKGRGF